MAFQESLGTITYQNLQNCVQYIVHLDEKTRPRRGIEL